MTSPREPIPSKKRKRNDDEDAESTIAQDAVIEPSYNSQFLNPSETATTRSTTKYKSRARISSPSARPLDFDVIPVKKPQVSSIFNTSKSKAVPLHMKKLDVSSIQPDKPISKKRSAPRPKLKLKQAEAEKHDPSPIVAPRTRVCFKRVLVYSKLICLNRYLINVLRSSNLIQKKNPRKSYQLRRTTGKGPRK